MNIDMNHKYQTRDGRAVRILATDLVGNVWPVIGVMMESNGIEVCRAWGANGISSNDGHPSDADLIPVPTKHEGWMPVRFYVPGGHWTNGRIYDSEQEAITATPGDGAIVAHVTWED